MSTPTFDEYQARALGRGFDEVLPRTWGPNEVVPEHAHPFSVEALVVAGEMWLTVGDATRHLLPGDTFTLRADEKHGERYGPAGSTYWAARRHPKAAAA